MFFNMNNFGAWLLETLHKNRISQETLRISAKLGKGTLSDVISGRREPGVAVLKGIITALKGKVPAHEVLQAAGLLPGEDVKTTWVRRVENKLTEIDDEDDQATIEGLIDLLSPDKKAPQRRHVKNEAS